MKIENNRIVFDYDGNSLREGDRVIVRYKGEHYEKTGIIYSLSVGGRFGDCGVKFDEIDENHVYWRTNLVKIGQIINIKTGEVFIVPYSNMKDLFQYDFIKYDRRGDFFYFEDSNSNLVQNYFY